MSSNILVEKEKPLVKIVTYGTKRRIEIPKVDIWYSCKNLYNPYMEYPESTGLHKHVRKLALYADGRKGDVLVKNAIRIIENRTREKWFEFHNVLRIAFSCYGGKHRSVAIGEEVAVRLEAKGYRVEIEHLELSDVEKRR